MSEFITFRKFNNPEEAGALVELLQKNDIEYQLSTEKPSEDIIFAGNTLLEELIVKLKSEDFETAGKLLEDIEEVNAESLDKDYYLFGFSDNELLDILQKPDEWSYNDYHWAKDILKQRGREVDASTVAQWKKERLDSLAKTEEVTVKYQMLAYFFCLTGGFIGIFMGRNLSASRKILPNGQKVFAYDEKARKLGYRITITGFVFLIAWIVLLFSVL